MFKNTKMSWKRFVLHLTNGIFRECLYKVVTTSNGIRTLDWENLETRWHLTKATFLYKVLSNSAAPILKDSFISRNILLNNYNLRNSQTDLTLPKPNREFLKRSFKYSGAYLWNSLPLEAKQAQSIRSIYLKVV